jgi:hypothetical protein
MLRLFIVGLVTSTIVGCTAQPQLPSPNLNWTRVSGISAGCVSFAPREREAVDLNILPTPTFEETLEVQLAAEVPKAPRCWYERPSGSVRLFAGDFCGVGIDAFFEQHDSEWKLVKTNDVWTNCRPKERGGE